MRVLHVYKDIFPPVHGGIEQHIALLAQLQAQAGHEVEVLVAGEGERTRTYEQDGYRVTRLREFGRAASSPLTAGFVVPFRRSSADIAHFHHPNPIGEVYADLLPRSVRVAVSYHADITRQRYLGAAYRPILRRLLARADVLITSSDRLRDTSPLLAPHRERCHIVPYGVEPPPPRSVERSTDTFLFVGRWREYKGLLVLVRAVARAPGTKARIVGDGPMRAELEAEITRLGLEDRVALLGDLDDDALDVEYRRAAALVLPSILRSEAFGIVLVEALHRGTPLVTTELGTGTSWVNQDGETGLVVAAGDDAALAEAMTRIASDADLRRRMGEGANQRAALFTPERLLNGIMDAYRSPR